MNVMWLVLGVAMIAHGAQGDRYPAWVCWMLMLVGGGLIGFWSGSRRVRADQ
jgi:hypothetical protein